MSDHVHMLISIPPKYSVSQVVGYIKGKSALHIARRIMRQGRNYIAYLKGRRGGRPKSVMPENLVTIRSLKKSGEFSIEKICSMAGVTRSVYYRAISAKATRAA